MSISRCSLMKLFTVSLLVATCTGFVVKPRKTMPTLGSRPHLKLRPTKTFWHPAIKQRDDNTARTAPKTIIFSSNNRALDNSASSPRLLRYKLAGAASVLAWSVISIITLSYHPDPKFVHCTVQHNILTMAQSFAFPLGVLWGGFGTLARSEDRSGILGCSLCLSHLYLMFATGFCPSRFAFGYDLVSPMVKVVTVALFGFSAAVSASGLRTSCRIDRIMSKIKGLPQKIIKSFKTDASSAVTASAMMGLFWFSIQPLVVGYPLATIPTILGKRLSRAASAFTFLGAVQMMTLIVKNEADSTSDNTTKDTELEELRRGLGIGSALHLLLILLKLIGVDDGGLLLPGRGLWTWYPAMMAVPFATAASCVVHLMTCLACILQ